MNKARFLPVQIWLQERGTGTEGMGRVFARGDRRSGPGEANALRSSATEGIELAPSQNEWQGWGVGDTQEELDLEDLMGKRGPQCY